MIGRFISAAASIGALIDGCTQVTSQYVKTGRVDISEIDMNRVAKTSFCTGIGAAIKALPGAEKGTIDVFGTILGWGECSTLITCTDIIVTNTYNSTKSVGKSTKYTTVQSKNKTCRITTTTADFFKQLYNGV